MKLPLLSKLVAVGLVMLLLGIVLTRIDWLVAERRMRQAQATDGVEQSLAGAQTLLGPLLHRSCTEEWDTVVGQGKDSRKTTDKREFALMSAPQSLQVTGDIRAEPRYRGLFKVNGFAGTTVLDARWPSLAALQPQREHPGSRLSCGPARLMLSVSDVRGLRSAQVLLDGETAPALAGTEQSRYPRGLHADLSDARAAQADRPFAARVTLDLLGTGRLALVPAAGETVWALRSDWPHPSFVGRFLPTAREVGQAGFSARWAVSSLASSAASDALRNGELCSAPSFGVDEDGNALPSAASAKGGACLDTLGVAFIDPVNPYVLTDRATKYALLFIVLTFGSVALTEVLARRRVHPLQYTLVGLALAMFYLLLLSLSEHIAFGAAYAVASAACVVLLGFYARHVLGRWRAGLAFGAGIALLYGALWVLLRMEQTALVIGSLLLFGVLAAVMVLTRRVDWYALFDGMRAPGGVAPAGSP